MGAKKDIQSGDTFGFWTIIEEAPRTCHNRRFICRCVCGKQVSRQLTTLVRGDTVSCGCKVTRPDLKLARTAKKQQNDEKFMISSEGRICAGCLIYKSWEEFGGNSTRTFIRTFARCAECLAIQKVLKRYNINLTQYESLLKEQDFSCGLCLKPFEGTPQIDHAHTCCKGKDSCGNCVRGFVCGSCNRALAGVEKSPRLAAQPIFAEWIARRPLKEL